MFRRSKFDILGRFINLEKSEAVDDNGKKRIKESLYVLDFVNSADDVLADFLPYFPTAELAGVSDPNIVFALQAKLDAAQIYSDSEVEAFAAAALNPTGKQAQLQAFIAPAVGRFRNRLAEAQATHNKLAEDELVVFRKDLGTFLRAYEFLAQIYDYENTDLEKRSIFYKLLLPWLKIEHQHQAIDLTAVELTHYRLSDLGQRNLPIKETNEEYLLHQLGTAGSAEPRDAELVKLSEIVAQMNELFAGELTDADLLPLRVCRC